MRIKTKGFIRNGDYIEISAMNDKGRKIVLSEVCDSTKEQEQRMFDKMLADLRKE